MTRWWLLSAAAGLAWALAVASPRPLAAQHAVAALPHAGVVFETSDTCLACHNGLATPAGEDVSIGASWRASMMAQSARDPYWHAAVRRETMDHPTHAAAIEHECATCHMPMAHSAARAEGGSGEVFALLPASGGTSRAHALAADGVSCALCHQIGPDGLGSIESFVGGFALVAAPTGAQMLGPYEIDAGRAALMRSATGATPAQGDHLKQSEICATCHTLITDSLDTAGRVVGSLPEQVPYLEWRHSAFAAERSCQSCHMPAVEDTPMASVLGEPRETIGRHTFLGGNFFMLRMLNRFRDDLGVTAPAAELEAAAQATLRQLETDTAEVAIVRLAAADGRLDADVAVRNLTGHKLPTGYPSRRVWLHLAVRDGTGAVIFESGAPTAAGGIRGNDNDDDAVLYEPHYDTIDAPAQVQIYEAILGDVYGGVTTGLLRGTGYLKDNRLLPHGFDKATADAAIAVHGGAAADGDFNGGGDLVRYRIALGNARGPFTVQAMLRYQPIGLRWADNFRGYAAPEPRRFVGYWDAMAGGASAPLARATRTLEAPSSTD